MEILLEHEERDAVAINPGMVQDEFISFPAQLSSFGARYADAISDAAAKAEQLEDIEAEVYLELRSSKTKEQTEATLQALVRRDTRVRMARELLLQAEATKARFKHKVMDPLYAKRDMLISLGAHQRSELVGDPLLRYASGGMRFTPPVPKEPLESLEGRAMEGGPVRGR